MAVTIRKNDIRAAVLFFLSFAVHMVPIFIYQPAIITTNFIFWGTLMFTLVVYFAISAGIWKGYRWAKILLVVLVLWQLIVYLPKSLGANNPKAAIALEVLSLALETCAAIIVLKDLLTRAPAAAPSEAGIDPAARQL